MFLENRFKKFFLIVLVLWIFGRWSTPPFLKYFFILLFFPSLLSLFIIISFFTRLFSCNFILRLMILLFQVLNFYLLLFPLLLLHTDSSLSSLLQLRMSWALPSLNHLTNEKSIHIVYMWVNPSCFLYRWMKSFVFIFSDPIFSNINS